MHFYTGHITHPFLCHDQNVTESVKIELHTKNCNVSF